jgi:hypothetical protein
MGKAPKWGNDFPMNEYLPVKLLRLFVITPLIVGCSEIAVTKQPPARLFELSIDSTMPFSVRRAAALELKETERAQLQQTLENRIPKKWNDAAEHDLAILSAIGNEDAAERLERIYPIPPVKMPSWADVKLPELFYNELLHDTVAEIRNRLGTHTFQTAEDPFASPNERVRAALRLDAHERNRLEVIAIDRLRLPYWDVSTDGDLVVLAGIGDERAARIVEAVYAKPGYSDRGADMETTLMQWVVRQIRKRELPAATQSLTPDDEYDFLHSQ